MTVDGGPGDLGAPAARGASGRAALSPRPAAADMCSSAAAAAASFGHRVRAAIRARRFHPLPNVAALAALLALCAAAAAHPLASAGDGSLGGMLPDAWATSMLPPVHPSTLDLSEYPPVGIPAKLTFTVTYADAGMRDASAARPAHPYVRLDVTGAGSDMYTVHNITSNVGTGAPDVFEPYDHAASTVVAELGRTYQVRADIVIVREGVVPIHALGLDGDIVTVYVAASESQSMPYEAYETSGQTYLDSVFKAEYVAAVGRAAPLPGASPPPPVPAPVPATPAPGADAWLDGLASSYRAKNASAADMHVDLERLQYTPSEIRRFLEDRMGHGGRADHALPPAGAPLSEPALPAADNATATFDVHGTVRADDFHSRPGKIGVHGITVCAYGYDALSAEYAPLSAGGVARERACALTTDEGAYRLAGVASGAAGGPPTRPLVVVAHANGTDGLYVLDARNRTYSQASHAVEARAGQSVAVDIDLNATNSGAGRIIDALSDARAYFAGHGIAPAPLAVWWQHDNGTSAFPHLHRNSDAYWPRHGAISLNGNSTLTSDTSAIRWVILHEFGHHVQHITRNLNFSCRLHYMDFQSDQYCAWGEGVANLVPHMVDGSAVAQRSDLIHFNLEGDRIEDPDGLILADFVRQMGFPFRVDMGPHTDTAPVVPCTTAAQTPWIPPCTPRGSIDLSWLPHARNIGERVEGRVAAALWDMLDSESDDVDDREKRGTEMLRGLNMFTYPTPAWSGAHTPVLDDLDLADGEMVAALFGPHGHRTMSEFYAAWEAANPGRSAEGIMRLHAMSFAIPNEERYYRHADTIELWYVTDLGVGSGDRIVAANTYTSPEHNTHSIFVMWPNGTRQHSFGHAGHGEHDYHGIGGLEVDALDRIVVSSVKGGRVQLYNMDGTHNSTTASPGHGPGQLHRPADVAVDSRGMIAVHDRGNSRIQVFDADAETTTAIKDTPLPYGPPSYHVNHAKDTFLAFDLNDRLAAANALSKGIAVYDGDHSYLYSIREFTHNIVPRHSYSGLDVHPDGRLVAATGMDASVVLYDGNRLSDEIRSSDRVEGLGWVTDVAVDSAGRIIVGTQHDRRIQIYDVDRDPPEIEGVSALSAGGGSRIVVLVNFSEAVTVTGLPFIQLAAGGLSPRAYYESGSGTPVLRFGYDVRPCDASGSSPVRHGGAGAFVPSGALIMDGSGNAANLTLPAPGGGGSLSLPAGPIVLGPGSGPCPPARVVSVAPQGAASAAAAVAGDLVNITVRFSTDVDVAAGHGGGLPELALDVDPSGSGDHATAPYASGNGTDKLVFSYEVRRGDAAGDLEYAAADSLSLNGGAITASIDGAPASVTLPEPGARGSLSHGADIAVDGAAAILRIGALTGGYIAAAGPSTPPSAWLPAVRAAAADFNAEQAGRAAVLLEVAVFDANAGGDPAAALQAAHAGGDGPSAYVGPVSDRALHAMRRYAADNGIVIVSPSSTAPSLAIPDDGVFRMVPDLAQQTAAAALLLKSAGVTAAVPVVKLENAIQKESGPLAIRGIERAVFDAAVRGLERHGIVVDDAHALNPITVHSLVTGTESINEAVARLESQPEHRGSVAVLYLGPAPWFSVLAKLVAGTDAASSVRWFAMDGLATSAQLASDPAILPVARGMQITSTLLEPPAGNTTADIREAVAASVRGFGSGYASDAVSPNALLTAYGAYDSTYLIGRAAAAASASAPAAAGPERVDLSLADAVRAAAGPYAGALGNISLNSAGDLHATASYGVWTLRDDGGRPERIASVWLHCGYDRAPANSSSVAPPTVGAYAAAGADNSSYAHVLTSTTVCALPRASFWPGATGPHSAGHALNVTVEFPAPVAIISHGGTPYLELRTGSSGARAPYESGNNTRSLVFSYAVREGDLTSRVEYAGPDALALNGSAIVWRDTGLSVSATLPAPGSRGSLSAAPPVQLVPDPDRPVLDIGVLDEVGPGGAVSEAVILAAERFNGRQGSSQGALLLNVTVYDAGPSPESAATALRAAHAGGSGPSLYVGPSSDGGLHAAMPYAAEHGIVLVSAGSTAPSLAVEGDRTFRLLPSDGLEAGVLADLARRAGAGSMHAVLENATYGPAGALETPPPPGRFSHGFAAALARSAVLPLGGIVTLNGTDGSYEAAAAAAALDASVRSGAAPAAVVYLGSPRGLAALAEHAAGYPDLRSASWLASGLSPSGVLPSGGRSPADMFAAQVGLKTVEWSLPGNNLSGAVASRVQGLEQGLLPGMHANHMHRAYAAHDAVHALGAAAASGPGGITTDAAEIAARLPGAAAAHAGALGDIALDPAGDLWVPAEYMVLFVSAGWNDSRIPQWVWSPGLDPSVDAERACSVSLERAVFDYGPINPGQTSRPHLQTVTNTGQMKFAQVELAATPWHVDSPGACAPGGLPSLPAGLTEIRTEAGGPFSDLAASGTVVAKGLKAGGQAPVWYRLGLAGYASMPQAEITQCVTYVVRCS